MNRLTQASSRSPPLFHQLSVTICGLSMGWMLTCDPTRSTGLNQGLSLERWTKRSKA